MPPRDRLREVLLHDWDPHDVMRRIDVYGESALSRYDTYLDPLIDLVSRGGGEEAVMAYLHEREAESMCFPSLGHERLRRVARRVIEAVGSRG